MSHFKDDILDRIARRSNVAQFVSFGPDLAQRHAWIRGHQPGHRFGSLEDAVSAILAASPEGTVNVRSWEPENPKSRSFLYARRDPGEILAAVRKLAGEGLYTILNETVDVLDGGVSGVAFGEALEFAPGDTPRCVEAPDAAGLPRDLGLKVLETVYGFRPALPAKAHQRVEFSLHPVRRGFGREHTILWEIEEPGPPPSAPRITWPNRFSRHLGDKTFGLLIADALGMSVPRTYVIPRGLAPFSFGTPTSTAETWIRTCPREQIPGRFTTRHGWTDPFRLLSEEDPDGELIASILSQDGVDARFSGALVAGADGEPLIEGVSGFGDEFMLGRRAPEELPPEVGGSLRDLYRRAAGRLGPVRFEWAHDGARAWIVQLHRGASAGSGRVIFDGPARRFRTLETSQGIDALRELIAQVEGQGEGIVLVGHVGVTSHFGDLLRRARVPSRIEEPA
ncbi:MAG: hypothetical protein ACJ75H_09810 [Thermoanaerobaculia bacterium]